MRNQEWMMIVFVLCVLLLGLIFWIAEDASAQMPLGEPLYMVIRHGYAGYDFDCVTAYPYVDLQPMTWHSVDGFQVGDFDFVESIIAVEACNIDNVYRNADGLFVWRMTDIEREGSRYAIHVNRGAYWIQPRVIP